MSVNTQSNFQLVNFFIADYPQTSYDDYGSTGN